MCSQRAAVQYRAASPLLALPLFAAMAVAPLWAPFSPIPWTLLMAVPNLALLGVEVFGRCSHCHVRLERDWLKGWVPRDWRDRLGRDPKA